MFKLVVLCAFFAAAAAKPGALIPAPITYYSTYLTPSSSSISKLDTSVIHQSPLLYHAPLTYTHYIKKRSPQFPLAYAAPATYYPNYWQAATYNAPLISAYNTPFLSTHTASVPAVHLIKKRSAPLISAHTTYAAAAPLLASTYTATAPIYTYPYHTRLLSQPIAYTHFIKK